MQVNPYYLLFLPAITGDYIIPGSPGSVNRKINGGNQPFISVRTPAGAPGPQQPNTKTPEIWYSSSEFGSFGSGRAVPGRELVHRLSTTTVDNLDGVWEF